MGGQSPCHRHTTRVLNVGEKNPEACLEVVLYGLRSWFPRFYKRSLVLRYKCVSTHEQQVPFTKQGKDFILTSQRSKLHKASYSTIQGGSRGQREGE